MSFPTTDPKFNKAFYHWTDASRRRYSFNLFEKDTLNDLLSHCSVEDLKHLATLVGAKSGKTKSALVLNIVESLKGEDRHLRGKISLSIVPVAVD